MAATTALDIESEDGDAIISDIAGARARRRDAVKRNAAGQIRPAVMAAINRQQSLLYLALILGQDIFGWDGLQILDVVACDSLAEMSDMPEFIRGGVAWQGEVVPVVDLDARLSRRCTPITQCTRIVIVEMLQAPTRQLLGIVMNPLPQAHGRLRSVGLGALAAAARAPESRTAMPA
jgi:hypothetical protein